MADNPIPDAIPAPGWPQTPQAHRWLSQEKDNVNRGRGAS